MINDWTRGGSNIPDGPAIYWDAITFGSVPPTLAQAASGRMEIGKEELELPQTMIIGAVGEMRLT